MAKIRILFCLLLFGSAFSLIGEVQEEQADYVLYLHARGELGSQLQNFFTAVKEEHLEDPVVQKFPPHCSLTNFFKGDTAKEKFYISHLKEAVRNQGTIRIKITSKTITKHRTLDFIPLSSPELLAVTEQFVKAIQVPQSAIKGKPGTFPYHITLRTGRKDIAKIRNFERESIHLKAKHLSKNTNWSLFLYKRQNQELTVVFNIGIKTH